MVAVVEGLVQAEARESQILLVSHVVGKSLSTWAVCCFSQDMLKLDGIWSSWGTHWYLYGMPVPQAVALPVMLCHTGK